MNTKGAHRSCQLAKIDIPFYSGSPLLTFVVLLEEDLSPFRLVWLITGNLVMHIAAFWKVGPLKIPIVLS